MNVLFFLLPKGKCAYIEDDFTLRQTLEKMEYHHYASIPLLNKEGKYIGTVSEGDLLWFIKDRNLSIFDSEKISIKEVKRLKDIKAISINNDIDDLVNLILIQNFVPIVDDEGTFIGIVRRSSVINYLVKQVNASSH